MNLRLAAWILLVMALLPCSVSANVRPVGTPQAVVLDEDTQKSIMLAAFDADNDSLTYKISSKPRKGTATQLEPGGSQVLYTPIANFFGKDTFSFTVSDGTLVSKAVKVSITVTPVNDAPVLPSLITTSTLEDKAKSLTLKGTDIDRNKLSYAIQTQASNGQAVIKSNKVTYTPALNFFGTDSFTYTAFDGIAHSAPGQITVTVTPVNDAPVALAQAVTVSTDVTSTISLQGSDVDGDTLTYALARSPKPKGSLGVINGSQVTYTPKTGVTTDSFAFTVRDQKLTSKAAVVTIRIQANPSITDPALLSCVGGIAPAATAQSFSCDGIDLSTADLSQLARLPNLRTLDLSHTKLSNISGLAGLTQLTNLNLGFNTITNISALAGMTQLQTLNLSFNTISDISALTGMNNLQALYLDANNLTTISALANKPALTKLYLDANQLTTITALASSPNLTELGLSHNQLSTITTLSGMSALQMLALDGNNLSDISALSGLSSLQTLYLRGNLLSNVAAISGLANLKTLELGFNTISTLPSLSSMTALQHVGLEHNALTDITALSGKTSLKSVFLEHNEIPSNTATINTLKTLTGLNTLMRLEHNRLLDVNGLTTLGGSNNLTLTLEDNCLSNISLPSRIKGVGRSWQFQSTHCGSTAPVAIGKSVEVLRNTVTTIYLDATDASNNSLNPSDANVSYTLVNTAGVTNGSLSVTGKGEVRFTPNTPTANNADLGAAGSFSFKVTYNGQASQEATVNLRVVHPVLVACYGEGSIPLESVLAGLSALNCSGKAISDIGILSHYFRALDKLELHKNAITDISSLTQANFPNLTALGLDENPLDAAALMALGTQLPNLKTLSLKKTQLDNADLEILFGNASSPKLQNVDLLILGGNQISSIQPLLHLNKMAILNLDDNAITDISALSPVAPAALPMPSLAELSLDKNRLTAVSLPRLSLLTYLQVSNNCLSSAPTVPASTSTVHWATQRSLVNGVCPAYMPPP
ncbi:leucine-rich repeat domain-containing protein [Thiothrix subterranea]|uniref:Ig-like domain-containing protein n=1 Tax=Thiothrix subterranea TaxID=2735563 RepID=A0AA51R350_9GAMM|nr:Ig-like domain-containing protein [Thiothrix subterranea]WML88599.1 Ig-like domain-containing protein [Thiothrix subterranea]